MMLYFSPPLHDTRDVIFLTVLLLKQATIYNRLASQITCIQSTGRLIRDTNQKLYLNLNQLAS